MEKEKKQNLSLQKEPIMEGKLTGYPSIDKPWMKYYRKSPIREIDSDNTIYRMIFESNKYNMDEDALEYLGVNIKFDELKKQVDKLAQAFYRDGVREGEVILVGVSNSLETVISLLAINKLGAISKWFDIRANANDIKQYLNLSNCKRMIAFDNLIPKIESILSETNLEKIFIINPVSCLSKFKQTLYSLKCKKEGTYIKFPKNNSKFERLENYIKSGDESAFVFEPGLDENKPAIMIQSSGTTGKPKTIIHSNKSVCSSIEHMSYSDLPLGLNKEILVALPPWIAYGLGNAILMPLSYGTKVNLCPNFDPDVLYNNIGNFTISFAAPFHYRFLRDNFNKMNKKQLAGYKKIECYVSGGDKISPEENKEFEEIFDRPLINGYGNNEGWGVLTVNPTKENHYGTVGIPKPKDIMISYNTESGNENKYGEYGEICSLTPSIMLGYENNDEETNKTIQQHSDGKKWLHTGDLGYIDEDGFIHLGGRARRVIVRLGFKLSAYSIEDKISKHPAVKECVAVSVKDSDEEHVPMVYITLKDKYKNLQEEIEKDIYVFCEKNLKENEIPKYFRIVEQMPYTPNNKYDFVKLENLGNDYVDSLNNKKNRLEKMKTIN